MTPTTTTPTLKPCPFCGEPALSDGRSVTCSGFGNSCAFGREWAKPERWNTRPIESALESRLAAAEARVKELDGFISRWGLGHDDDCGRSDRDWPGQCTCGRDEAWKALSLTNPK